MYHLRTLFIIDTGKLNEELWLSVVHFSNVFLTAGLREIQVLTSRYSQCRPIVFVRNLQGKWVCTRRIVMCLSVPLYSFMLSVTTSEPVASHPLRLKWRVVEEAAKTKICSFWSDTKNCNFYFENCAQACPRNLWPGKSRLCQVARCIKPVGLKINKQVLLEGQPRENRRHFIFLK